MNTQALSPRMKAKFAKYAPRVRAPNEALPNTLSIKDRPEYVPPVHQPARQGAADFLRIHSRGCPT